MMSKRLRATILLAVAACLWSLAGLFIKLIDANPLVIAGIRSLVASAVILFVLKKTKLVWSVSLVGAALSYAATAILFVTANKLTTSANAIFLQFTAPIYVALFGKYILNERTKLIDWITVFFVFGGMTLFFIENLSSQGFLGNFMAATTGITFAFFTMFMRKQKDGSPLESVFLGNILIALIGLPFLVHSVPNSSSWLFLIILGVVQLGIPYVLYSKAIKHITAIEAVLIPVIEPILNPIWVLLFFNERPSSWAILGGGIVIISILISSVIKVSRPKDLRG
jgi:drug/metabolite transporter (DMT)-like permease